MTEGFAAVALHRPSRPENIGGVLRAADVYGVALVVLGGGALPPDPLGHPTDTTQAWRRIPVVFSDDVLTGLPGWCVPVAVERVAEATPLPELGITSLSHISGPTPTCGKPPSILHNLFNRPINAVDYAMLN